MILTTKNVSRKKWRALNERTFGWQKSRINWPYPHGERREVMIATLRWAIVCTAAFPRGLCVEMRQGKQGMAWAGIDGRRAGNFILGGAYLSAYL